MSNKTFNNPIFLSRSRPVVRVSATVELEAFDGKIDPENRTCSLLSGTKVACLSLQGCLLYEGEAVTEELGNNWLLISFNPKKYFLLLFLHSTITEWFGFDAQMKLYISHFNGSNYFILCRVKSINLSGKCPIIIKRTNINNSRLSTYFYNAHETISLSPWPGHSNAHTSQKCWTTFKKVQNEK